MKKIIFSALTLFLITSCNTNTTETTQNQETQKTEIIISENTPTYGNGEAKLEVFADFQCPACQTHNELLAPTFEELAENWKLTIVYRQYPLSWHINAANDALAAMCANDQGKYMEYKKALYNLEISKNNKPVTDAERIALATANWLDEETFSSCLKDKKYADYVKSDVSLGQDYKIPGTPTYVLDGKIFNISQFKASSNEELLNQVKQYFENYSK